MNQAYRLVLAISLILSITAPTAEAQENLDQPGAMDRFISVERLVPFLNSGDWIEDALIFGPDLAEALAQAEDGGTLRIRDAVIIGPVVLRRLDNQTFLRDLSNKEWPRLIERAWSQGGYSYRIPIHLVDQRILIDRSVWLSWSAAAGDPQTQKVLASGQRQPPDDKELILEAEQVLFRKGIFLTRSRLAGRFSAPGAVFAGQSTFWSSTFERVANFDAATFLTLKRSTLSYIPMHFTLRSFPERPYNFDRATFAAEASFRDAHFLNEAGFRSATFVGRSNWQEAEFGKGADFAGTSFEDVADFTKTRLKGPGRFDNAKFGGDSAFDETRFVRPVSFAGAEFRKAADFSKAEFTQSAAFARSKFHATTSFSEVVFPKSVDFERSQFMGLSLFVRTRFNGEASFEQAEFHGHAALGASHFLQEASFRDAWFRSTVEASVSKFAGKALFLGARFEDRAGFDLSTFDGRVDFSNTRFVRSLSFSGATFNDELNFENLTLDEYGDFRGTSINTFLFESSRQPSLVSGRLDFRSAEIGTLCLSDVTFLNDVDFTDATLGAPEVSPDTPCGRVTSIAHYRDTKAGVEDSFDIKATVDFVSATFAANLFLIRASFRNSVKFEHVRANKIADFTGATFQDVEDFTWSFSDFRQPILSWGQFPNVTKWQGIKGLQPLSEVLDELAGRFRAQRQIDDANSAYYQAKRAKLKELRSTTFAGEAAPWQSASFADWVSAEATWWVWGLLSGYGTKLWWCLAWAVGLVSLFAALFVRSGDLRRVGEPIPAEDTGRSLFRQRLLDYPRDFTTGGESAPTTAIEDTKSRWYAALRLSGAVLLKVGPRDAALDATGGFWTRNLLRLEWALGYYVVATLVYTLSETWPLLNRLLAGIL